MIKPRFDPATGAPLSREKHYDPETGVGCRTPEPGDVPGIWTPDREGALTNGELCSAQEGLKGYFKRVHRKAREPEPSLDCAAALAFKRVKAAREHVLDTTAWYCVAERLCRKGHWVAWMLDHATPRCPHCEGELKFRRGATQLEGVCASAPNQHNAETDLRADIRDLYEAAFDDEITALQIIE